MHSIRKWLGGQVPHSISKIGVIESDQMDEMKNEKGQKYKSLTTRYSLVAIGKDGKVLFENLEVGKYRVTESKAPEGYQLSKTSIEVEITGNNRSIRLIAENEMKIELPEAGEINYTIIFSTIGIIVMFIAIVIIKFNNKISLQK